MAMDLGNRKVIVTGAGSGIGREIAVELAERGAKVVVADISREPKQADKPTDDLIRENGGDAIFVENDVSDEDSVRNLVYTAAEHMQGVDALVNNAGIHHAAPIHEETRSGWNKIVSVNLTGAFLCMKHVLQHMLIEDVQGDIVNIGSIAGLVGFQGSAAYCASKGGIVELTRQAASDYGSKGININAVDPGVIRTDMTVDMLEDERTRGVFEEKTLSPRLGEPKDIAATVAFLISSEADFIMGENIVVDGGWTAL